MTVTKQLLVCGLLLTAILACAGCAGSCHQDPNANIRVAVKDRQVSAVAGLGVTRHHNITFSVANAGPAAGPAAVMRS